MTISREVSAQILRSYHVEGWRVGTIARQLGIHHDVVRRVLDQDHEVRGEPRPRATLLDPYLPFLRQTLEKFPNLTGTRLHAMLTARGYTGGVDHLRERLRTLRPRRTPEAYLRLTTLPGEQAQVDWAHFSHLVIGQARRPLMGFVMVLSYSRQIHLEFFLNARMGSFLHGHVHAFEAFTGVPRVLLYDNLKSAVLERMGSAIRFNPELLEFAAHYRYEPRPVAVARGNEKGRVERAIRYIRENFFAGRTFTTVEDLNQQARQWCQETAASRACREQPTQTVAQVFAQEQPKLMALPADAYPVCEMESVKVGKTPYVRFDLNDYSVPHEWVQRLLTVRATSAEVRILHEGQLVACHPRSYDRGRQIEDPRHIEQLVQEKRMARQHRGMNRLTHAIPEAEELLLQASGRGDNLGGIVSPLLDLLDRYGATETREAILEALRRGVPHPNAVRLSLERKRQGQHRPPPLDLPDHIKQRDVIVRPVSLDGYDQLYQGGGHNHE